MSLYDDEEVTLPGGEAVGWSRPSTLAPPPPPPPPPPHTPAPSSSSSSLQPPLKIVKGVVPAASTTITTTPITTATPPITNNRRSNVLAPVVNLQSTAAPFNKGFTAKQTSESSSPISQTFTYNIDKTIRDQKALIPLTSPNWQATNEYDPLWPNDYEKVVSEIREMKRNSQEEQLEGKKRRYTENSREKARERFHQAHHQQSTTTGFSSRRPEHSDEEDEENGSRSRGRRDRHHRRSASSGTSSSSSASSGGVSGAAIAPPPSLMETSSPSNNGGGSLAGLGVAAKIMAKYGYKQGQGLGRDEQGMSMALSVEKTSKRGGRIVHEKDLAASSSGTDTPPNTNVTTDDYGNPSTAPSIEKPSITDLMKNPSKVVLCKNMVGPGEVDEFLEPEVKEECNDKYGDVTKVVIYEVPNAPFEEEAVRIFIEFKRVESAIKAVVDLNGRFFGGREVQARFYDLDKFNNLCLDE